MRYDTFTLTSSNQSIAETEILYSIASARANQMDFLKLILNLDQGEKIATNTTRVLKSLKKQGRIELYISSDELGGDSTEAEYLRNKFPEICNIRNENETSIIIKI